MLKVRTTKTGSKNTAVQVVYRKNQKTIIVKHIGTAKNSPELKQLLKLANQYIVDKSKTIPLFPELFETDNQKYHLVAVENLEFTSIYHNFAYEFLSFFYELNGFDKLNNELFKDLSIIRIIEPASKLKSVELIFKYFGIKHTKNKTYKGLSEIRLLKQSAEEIALNYAKSNLEFDFTIVFYDITTLYFETFQDDELRKFGYSKDNKSNQPQILVALVVNKDGYPITIDIFEGNKFEGHTMIPVILKLKEKHNIDDLTVVADAAMLSFENIKSLEKHGLNYIVGARLSNLCADLLKQISLSINKKENIYFKTKTPHGILICDYSAKRASKDKSDRNKQIKKAQHQINNPNTATRRLRFVKETTKSVYELNKELIEKNELLDGLKGYHTNLKNVSDDLIVSRYKDLWNIEKSFRIAKSDLMARPIYHRRKESIEAHILVIFVSLCISKSIEILTGLSIKKVRDYIWSVADIRLKDKLTNREFQKRLSSNSNPMVIFLKNIRNLSTY